METFYVKRTPYQCTAEAACYACARDMPVEACLDHACKKTTSHTLAQATFQAKLQETPSLNGLAFIKE